MSALHSFDERSWDGSCFFWRCSSCGYALAEYDRPDPFILVDVPDGRHCFLSLSCDEFQIWQVQGS